jgi:peptidoglycan/LPS O-acetylase OafA/YrhL
MLKIRSLTALRGIAALLVALDHIILKASGCTPDSALFYFATFLGSFGVGSFFLLSGFVIYLSLEKTNSIEFLWNRILRIYPIIIAAVTIRLISQVMMGQRIFDLATFKLYLLNISLFGNFFINVGDNFEPIVWTLAIEVKFYILMAIIFGLSRGPFRVPMVPMLLSVAVGLGSAGIMLPAILSPAMADWAVTISSLPVLFIGTAVCLFYKKIIILNKLFGMVALLLLAFSFTPITENVSFSKNFLAWILAGVLFWYCLYSARLQSLFETRWLMLLGAISYPLYAIHTAVIEAVVYFNRTSGASALFLRGIILAIVVAYALHRLIEDPVQRWVKRRALRSLELTVKP